MPLNALVEELKTSEIFREWDFSIVKEDEKEKISYLYTLTREAKGIAKAKIYLNQETGEKELNKFGIACLVVNPLNKELEKDPDKQHFYDIKEFEKYISAKGKYINEKYFTRQTNQKHSAPNSGSSS